MKPNAIYAVPPAAPLVTRLRKICSQLLDVTETVSFGHPTFQVGGKTFAVFEQYKGELGLAVKVEKELQQVFLKDPRFDMTPYAGKHGWVTLRTQTKPLDWKEVRKMIRGSHRLVAPNGVAKRKPRTVD
jgi:predicted DNA-binding protein (MmcQ/YjbR family)